MKVKRLCQFSPAVVVGVWAVVGLAGLDSTVVTALFRTLFAITLALHIRWEWNDRRRHKTF